MPPATSGQASPLSRPHNFAPVDDRELVFGACRPGFPARQVALADIEAWLDFMRAADVTRVVCLLAGSSELKMYRRLHGGLLGRYKSVFGDEHVLHAPIRDYHLSSTENLAQIIAFLRESEQLGEKAVVHCAGGSGRSGHVLAAWLVQHDAIDVHAALVQVRETGRNPYESIERGEASETDLIALLESVR